MNNIYAFAVAFVLLALGAPLTRAADGGTEAAAAASRPRLVFLIGEDQYRTEETLPAFARQELEPRGFHVDIVTAAQEDRNDFPGLIDALRGADLVLVSVRRRTPPPEQLDALRAHLAGGKPLVGLRTASHAFALNARDRARVRLDGRHAEWPGFDREVLGGNYADHYKAGPPVTIATAPGADDHPILRGIARDRWQAQDSLYRVRPLAATATPLLIGSIPDHPAEPLAWTHTYGPNQARVFYCALGQPEDFADAAFRRLLLNGIRWSLDRPALPGTADRP